jgi:hypothetical protein
VYPSLSYACPDLFAKTKTASAKETVLVMHAIARDVRTIFMQKKEYIYIPDLSLKT